MFSGLNVVCQKSRRSHGLRGSGEKVHFVKQIPRLLVKKGARLLGPQLIRGLYEQSCL